MIMSRIPHFRFGMAIGALALVSCIERSNPFDPINGSPEAAVEVRKQDKPALDTLVTGESAFAAILKGFLALIASDSTADAGVVKANAARRLANHSVQTSNDAIAAANRAQTVRDSLRQKGFFGSLDTLQPYGPYAGFATRRSELHSLAVTVSGHITGINESHFPLLVYGPAFIDSVFKPFVRDSLGFARAQTVIDSANAAVADSNLAVRGYNDLRAAENLAVRGYNDSIDYVKRTQNVNVITKSDSLQAITFVAKAGDSLYLGPGVFNVDLRFTNSGTPDSPIVVRGYPGRATILKTSDKAGGSMNTLILTQERKFIRFENLVFRGGVEGSVKLEGNATNISFRNCLFDSSQGPGLEVYDSDMEMTDCEVRANGGVGVKVGGGTTPGRRMRFTNVLFARNGGAGLECTSQFLELKNCTLAHNGGDGIQIISPLQAINIANTVISLNTGFGINRQATHSNQELLSVTESDLFGNIAGNWNLPQVDSTLANRLISANPKIDPEFIDASAFDYRPKPGSGLDAYEKQALPVIIGYRKPAP